MPSVFKADTDPRLLESEPIPKLLWQYAVPSVISTLSTSLYNLADRAFIGQGAGAMAISGLALTFPIMILLQAFGTLVGVGASTRVSIVLGMKDREWAEHILGNALFLTVAIWLTLCSACLVFLHPLLIAFGGSEETIPYAASYLKIIIPTYVLCNLSYSFCNIMRAAGGPTRSMVIMLVGVAINLILDPLFIFVFHWGIQGAAWATVISMSITSVLTMQFFCKKEAFIRFKWRNLKPVWFIIRNITTIGVAPWAINVAASVVAIIINHKLRQYGGDIAVGAYGVVHSYAPVFVMFVIGLCQGMQPIVGYNYGAGKLDRSKSVFRLSIRVASIITSAGFVLIELFPGAAASVFTQDPHQLQVAKKGLQWCFLLFPFVGFQIVTTQFFQSLSKAWLAIFLSLTRQVLFLIPALFVCSALWGLNGVWIATPVADFFSIVITAWVLTYKMRHFDEKPIVLKQDEAGPRPKF